MSNSSTSCSFPVPVRQPLPSICKRVKNVMLLNQYKNSQGLYDITDFLSKVNLSLLGTSLQDDRKLSTSAQTLTNMLIEMKGWVADIPAVVQAQRFGNTAFRTWHKRATQAADEFIAGLLPEEHQGVANEIKTYWLESFGNNTRIDYGTGHELCFITMLTALTKLGVFQTTPQEYQVLALDVFRAYLNLVRELQKVLN